MLHIDTVIPHDDMLISASEDPNETTELVNISTLDTESDSAFVDESLEFWISKNIRTGSMLVFWFLKSKALRLMSIALHKWARLAKEPMAYKLSPNGLYSLKRSIKDRDSFAFADTVHDAILDGKRNLLCKKYLCA